MQCNTLIKRTGHLDEQNSVQAAVVFGVVGDLCDHVSSQISSSDPNQLTSISSPHDLSSSCDETQL